MHSITRVIAPTKCAPNMFWVQEKMRTVTSTAGHFDQNSDQFVDILSDVRRLGSLRWVLRSRQFPDNGDQQRSTAQIAQHVLESERVIHFILY